MVGIGALADRQASRMNPRELHTRLLACRRCSTPCDHRAEIPWVERPDAACPRPSPAWTPTAPGPAGLGDVVHSAAKPVVAIVKAVTGGRVDLGECGGCHGPGGRRERWNAAVPFR